MTLPSGTVTFLFTDVEGSTELVRRLRDGYQEVLSAHQGILRDAVSEAGGSEIDTQGDSFFFVFPRARNAVLAAANAQRALAAHGWPEGGVLRVRMGIHTGEAAAVDGRYTGVAVHRASRISAIAHGGQVLLSQTTRNLLEDEEELPLDLRDLGEQRLKDFDRPVRVYQLDIPGLQERFAPLRTVDHREPRVPRRPAGRRRWPLLAGAALLGAGALAAVLALTLGGSRGTAVAAHSVAVIDPAKNAVVADVHVGGTPTALAAGDGGVWVVSRDAKTLAKLDPRSRKVTATSALPGIPSDVAVGDGAVWVLHSSSLQPTGSGAGSIVSRIDPRYLDVQRTIDAKAPFDDTTYADPIAVGHGIWIGAAGGPGGYGYIIGLDPRSGHVDRRIIERGGAYGAQALAADAGATWAVTGSGVQLIDPRTGEVTGVPGPGTAGPKQQTVAYLIALGQGKTWVAGEAFENCGDPTPNACRRLPGVLWRVDPATNGVDAQTRIGRQPSAIGVGDGAIWVGDRRSKTVWRIDPRTLRVVQKIDLGQIPADIVVANGLVWVALGD